MPCSWGRVLQTVERADTEKAWVGGFGVFEEPQAGSVAREGSEKRFEG